MRRLSFLLSAALVLVLLLTGVTPSGAHRLPPDEARAKARAEAQRLARDFSPSDPDQRPTFGIPHACERISLHVMDCQARYAFKATAKRARFVCHQLIRVRYPDSTSRRVVAQASLNLTCDRPPPR